ncbi:MAG TPA: copper homeostasis protein CutC [Acidobacteriaceae bacterium]|nr:copper homeostasis protein CutC [Acidobacteriaceae bacterium]
MDLEICVDSVESAIAAAQGGAERLELCSALGEGGITPSIGLIRAVRDAVDIDVFLMIRPRGGDFVYSDREFAVMQEDIVAARELGANGIAVGILTSDGDVDVERTRRLVELARPMQVTFHRAFDFVANMERALEDVIATGADRVLTSGGEADADRGLDRLAHLQRQAGNRIRVMAGGGVRESNVCVLVERTGVREVHTSLNNSAGPAERNGNHLAGIGARAGEGERFLVREEDVRRIHAALESVAK